MEGNIVNTMTCEINLAVKNHIAFKLETSSSLNESITSHSNAFDVNNYLILLICLEAFVVLLQLSYTKNIFN